MTAHESITVTRIGAIYNPPTFLVEYRTDDGTCYHRKIKIQGLGHDADTNHVSTSLISSFPEYLAKDKVPWEQVARMVGKIIEEGVSQNEEGVARQEDISSSGVANVSNNEVGKGALSASPTPRLSREQQKKLENFGDLNRVEPRVLQRAKAEMEVAFNAACLKPGDEGYVFDKREDFSDPELDSSWD